MTGHTSNPPNLGCGVYDSVEKFYALETVAVGTLLALTDSADPVPGQVNKYQPAFLRAGR